MKAIKKKHNRMTKADLEAARQRAWDEFVAKKNAEADAFIKKNGLPKQIVKMQKKRKKEAAERGDQYYFY